MAAGAINYRLRLQGEDIELAWAGFTSTVNLHCHYMTHVARLCRAEPDERRDPERWQELWGDDPQLPAELPQRRAAAVERLRRVVPRCALARKAPTADQPCATCHDPGSGHALRAVDAEFDAELGRYAAIVADAIEDGLRGQGPGQRPVFYVERGAAGRAPKLKLLAPQRVEVVAALEREHEQLRVITGYRPTRGDKLKPYNTIYYDFEQKRRAAAMRRAVIDSDLAGPAEQEVQP